MAIIPHTIQYTLIAQIVYIHFHALEKEMATHSSVLAWRIPGGSLIGCRLWDRTVGHDWRDLAAAAAAVCIF